MGSQPILDIETLLAPIAGPNPAGVAVPFPVRRKLDDARKEINPSQFSADDPRRPEQAQSADWGGIAQLAQETLVASSKDLLVAGRLVEALVKQHGFACLPEGLRLMRRLIEECWDRIYPGMEDGDLEPRAAAFNWLDDERRSALFPHTIRAIPLTQGGQGQEFGWQQWRNAQDAKGLVTADAFDRAVTATPREYCQAAVDDIGESVRELEVLTKVLSARMGEVAPSLAQIRKALLECQVLAEQILKRKGPAPVAAQASAVSNTESSETVQSEAPRMAHRPLTRDEVLGRLADASALLLQMEPHSPIAYLVQRAVKLARLSLPDLMRVLVRDQDVLGQLDRDLDLGLEKKEGANMG
jgi:type VI secretion system protein ImpA